MGLILPGDKSFFNNLQIILEILIVINPMVLIAPCVKYFS